MTLSPMSDDLDDDFPGDDGPADVEAIAWCPYCGEENSLSVDPGGGPLQRYVEDCHVCCRLGKSTLANSPRTSPTNPRARANVLFLRWTGSPPDWLLGLPASGAVTLRRPVCAG